MRLEKQQQEDEEARLLALKKGGSAAAAANGGPSAEGGLEGPVRREDVKVTNPTARGVFETLFFPRKVPVLL